MRPGSEHLLMQTDAFSFESILDIGTGSGFAARHFAERNRKVTATGFDVDSYITDPLPTTVQLFRDINVLDMNIFPDQTFDAVWCSHVIEHCSDVGMALSEIRRVLKPDGWLFLQVPEYTPLIVGGHLSPGWNLGILMYILILSGFNVREGHFINHEGNITGFVRKTDLPSRTLRYDAGDIETLADLFPPEVEARQGFRGNLFSVQWKWWINPAVCSKAHRRFRLKRLFRDLLPYGLMVQLAYQKRYAKKTTG